MTEFSKPETEPQSCPFLPEEGVAVSTNTRHLRRMMISMTDPAVNTRSVTHPESIVPETDFEPWMEPDNEIALAVEIRKAVYYNNPERTCYTANNNTAIRSASQQLLELQANYLVSHFPEMYSIESDDTGSPVIKNYATDDMYPLHPDEKNPDHLHPLAISGLLGQEDFCLVEEREGKHYMVAGFLASPTDWDLSMFMDMDMDGVHKYVEDYSRIKKVVDHILTNLPEYPDGIYLRNNMFYRMYGLLGYIPDISPAPAPESITDPGQEIFLRSERETLARLPATTDFPDNNRFIVFSIKGMNFPLNEASELRHDKLLRATQKRTKLGKSPLAPKALEYLESKSESND